MRARYPDRDGYVDRGGVKVFYEVFGEGEPTILLLPTWSIIHSRFWKMQIPYLSRHYRVITFDGRGNGRSDRPVGPEQYAETEFAEDAVAVMDATGTERAVIVGLSRGAIRGTILAATHADRVEGAVFVGPATPMGGILPERQIIELFDEVLPHDESWAKYNRHYWMRDFPGFLEFFFQNVFVEPHSTKQREDAVGWGLETTPETLIDTAVAPSPDVDQAIAVCGRIRCPVLVIQGTEDAITGRGWSRDRALEVAQLILLDNPRRIFRGTRGSEGAVSI